MLAEDIKDDDVKELGELIRHLRVADTQRRVFGASSHDYKLGPTLSEHELRDFEQSHAITLPADYRLFLREVGNGGAGPSYGLETLDTAARSCQPGRPFPFTQASNTYPEPEVEQWADELAGVLEICHHGCAIYSYLVVNGPASGTIWEGQGEASPTNSTFGVWYRRWAERALRLVDTQKLVAKVRVGMTVEQVITTTGVEWTERVNTYSHELYLISPDIPAQLVLSRETGQVEKINHWPFI